MEIEEIKHIFLAIYKFELCMQVNGQFSIVFDMLCMYRLKDSLIVLRLSPEYLSGGHGQCMHCVLSSYISPISLLL